MPCFRSLWPAEHAWCTPGADVGREQARRPTGETAPARCPNRLTRWRIALDDAAKNLVGASIPLPIAVAAATANPAALLGLDDRGRIEVGRRADLVLLGDDLAVRRVMIGGA